MASVIFSCTIKNTLSYCNIIFYAKNVETIIGKWYFFILVTSLDFIRKQINLKKNSLLLLVFTVVAYDSFGQKISPISVNVIELAQQQELNPPSKYKNAAIKNEAKENLFQKE